MGGGAGRVQGSSFVRIDQCSMDVRVLGLSCQAKGAEEVASPEKRIANLRRRSAARGSQVGAPAEVLLLSMGPC